MLYIAADHAGLEMKKHLVKYIQSTLKQQVKDLGADKFDKEDDFTDFAIPLAREVAKDEGNMGILICGSGHGMCIAANKIKGIRASLAANIESAEWAKKDDNINVLCLAGLALNAEHAEAIVKKFLETKFDDQPKRVRRLAKIAAIEK